LAAKNPKPRFPPVMRTILDILSELPSIWFPSSVAAVAAEVWRDSDVTFVAHLVVEAQVLLIICAG